MPMLLKWQYNQRWPGPGMVNKHKRRFLLISFFLSQCDDNSVKEKKEPRKTSPTILYIFLFLNFSFISIPQEKFHPIVYSTRKLLLNP
jgi:hypothetical protein